MSNRRHPKTFCRTLGQDFWDLRDRRLNKSEPTANNIATRLTSNQFPEGRECHRSVWRFYPLCGAHLLRELTYFKELSEVTQAWASPLKGLLLEMKGVAEHERRGQYPS